MDLDGYIFYVNILTVSYHRTEDIAKNKIERLLNGKENTIKIINGSAHSKSNNYSLYSIETVLLED